MHSALMRNLRLGQYEQTLRKELATIEDSGIKEIVPFGTDSKIFLYLRNSMTQRVIKIAGYLQIGNWMYEFKTDAVTAKREEEIEKLRKLAAIIRPRTDNEMPNELGMCVDGAFAAGKEFESESVGD